MRMPDCLKSRLDTIPNKLCSSFYVLLFITVFYLPFRMAGNSTTFGDPVAANISWSPGILSASTVEGSNAPAQSFSVWNSGGGALSYSIAVNQSWLSCFPASGTSTGEHDSIAVSYSTASLSLGTHSATITISGPAAQNSPRTIPVTLEVTRFPQAIIELNFEEGGGTIAYDSSGNNNNGTLEGGVVYTTDRAVGAYALSFDGVDDRIVCPGNSSLRPDDISISLWVKHLKNTTPPNYGGIIQGAFGDGYYNGFRMLDYRNRPLAQISFGDAEPVRMIGTAFTMNEWSHIVVAYDHTKIRLYQDGQLIVEQPETRNLNWGSYAGDLRIGLAQWNFSGLIDEVLIFDSALTAQMVQKLYGEIWAVSRRNPRANRPGLPPGDRWRETRQLPSLPEASLAASPGILSAFAMAGKNAPAQSFELWNSGEETLSYSIDVDQNWLKCFPVSDTSLGEHDSITVSYSTASLPVGTYSATIIISDPGANNSPKTIPVNLQVASFPRAIIELNFEEGDGTTALDASGNENNGTLHGGVVYTADRAEGSYALSFDGINDRVSCPANLGLRPDNLSVSLWVKHTKDTNSSIFGGIIQGAYGNGFSGGFRIEDSDNGPVAQVNFGDAIPVTILGLPFAQNEWSHVVLTYNHARIRLYQDGLLVAERPESRDINWASYASDLTIGLAQWYFKGLIDKVMLFDTALNASQVQKLYRDR